MAKRKQFDWKQPGAKELWGKIVHGAFKTEGQMVAFPLCFPSVSIPIPGDESRVTALDVTSNGVIYGGTSGFSAHLFVAMFHGVTGLVFDMGVAEGCDHTAAICCGPDSFIAAVNGPEGGRLVLRELQGTPFDLIQEWHIERSPYTWIDLPFENERILHTAASADRSCAIGKAEHSIFKYCFEKKKVEILGEAEGNGRLAVAADGTIVGRDQGDSLWVCDSDKETIRNEYVFLPDGDWDTELVWGTDPVTGLLYTADADARLFSYDSENGWSDVLAEIPYAPVTSMAVTFDGRVFGSSGTDMQRMFCYDPEDRSLKDIGVGVSTLERRRYIYSYGDAVTGRDGEIVFGENDDLGHLWLYFPRIKNSRNF